MNTLVMLFSLFIGAIAQALLPAWSWLGLAKAPILLGIAIYYASTRGRRQMLLAAVMAGVLQDALGMIPFGYSSCCFCLVGLAVNRFRTSVFIFRGVTHFIVGGLASGLVTGVLAVLLWKNMLINFTLAWTLQKVVGAIVLGAVFVPLVFRLIEELDIRLGILEEST